MKKNKALERDIYYGAGPETLRLAADLRREMTKAERILWEQLRGKKLGTKFRRQHPIREFIADFYCHEKKLVVEVDGSFHDIDWQKERDAGREIEMANFGIYTLRFTNDEVDTNIDAVLGTIKQALEGL